ncbi:hypothetical protein [Desulfosporosinus fructosivorans]
MPIVYRKLASAKHGHEWPRVPVAIDWQEGTHYALAVAIVALIRRTLDSTERLRLLAPPRTASRNDEKVHNEKLYPNKL